MKADTIESLKEKGKRDDQYVAAITGCNVVSIFFPFQESI
jgi:hypothetical protein